jgi:hypothetical protein
MDINVAFYDPEEKRIKHHEVWSFTDHDVTICATGLTGNGAIQYGKYWIAWRTGPADLRIFSLDMEEPWVSEELCEQIETAVMLFSGSKTN